MTQGRAVTRRLHAKFLQYTGDNLAEVKAFTGDARMSTAGELADYLAAQPRERKVVLRKDAEGNGHSPLAEAGEALYVADTAYSGEVYPTAEDVAAWVAEGHGSEDDWTVPDDGERVIVLGPVN